ncbi:MAG: DUF2141 domain-containing protein [Saprospiraceae bacterium]|nr:DUF2141 domain-containing protein [Saprospiraceae bacterium]
MKNLIILIFLLPLEIFACSAFFSDGTSKFFAKNFDWAAGEGYIIVNKSGQKKFAYGLRGNNQASWTSKYGSLTFNQIGKEFPYGGMNEKGLVIEQLWLSQSMYQDNKNQTISELEWIQYQLDNYTSVDEIIKHINDLTIKPIATIHYFIADRSGNSAVIDFIEGKTLISRKQGMNQVITNEPYLNSEKYFESLKTPVNADSRTHFDRYCQIKSKLSQIQIENHNQAFEILSLSAENRTNYKTYWSIVYDLSNFKIYYKSLSNPGIKEINFKELDFKPDKTLQACNINEEIFQLQNYTYEVNEYQFLTSMKMMGVKLDNTLGATHQMNPDQNRIDKVYQDNYIDLTINFVSKDASGNIFYTLLQGEENYKFRKGTRSGMIPVYKKENKKIIYGVPKGDYAVACFQDSDLDNKMDKKIFGIPKNFGFSRNKKGFFGTPPKYPDAKIDLFEDTEITIKIK